MALTDPGTTPRLLVLIPVFDDWEVLPLLLTSLDAMLAEHGLRAEVVVVDDGSPRSCEEALRTPALRRVDRVRLLALKRNMGHQRAIAVALAWVYEHLPPAPVVLMDGDGEDDPRDVPRLLEGYARHGGRRIVFAARRKRSESWLFRVLYRLFQLLHVMLTGRGVRVGNFSVIPPSALARLVVTSEIWNHYAAAVFNSRIAYDTVPTARAKRLAGESRMNLTGLVAHGLSALSTYGPTIGVRVVAALLLLVGLSALALVALVGLPLARGEAVPGALLVAGGVWTVLLLQAAFGGVLFVFLLLSSRQGTSFIPVRDYVHFVARTRELELPRPVRGQGAEVVRGRPAPAAGPV